MLLRMLDDLGEHDLRQMHLTAGEPGYSEILPTTWRELLDDGLVDDELSVMGTARFRLTTYDWIRALMVPKKVDEPAFRDRCTGLARAMKSVVKGRESHYDGFAHVRALAVASRLHRRLDL